MQGPHTDTDVFIAGGGMVGLTLGVALAQGGLKVTLADPLTREKVTAPSFDGRVSALSYSSVRMYRALGLWRHLEGQAQQINDILVTDAGLDRAPSPFSLHFDHNEAGEPLGYMVENRHIRAGLFAGAEAEKNLTLLSGSEAKDISVETDRAVVTLKDGREIAARVVIAADGRESRLREAMGIETVAWKYAQHGIVTTATHERPHHGVAYEHFLPSGPFAILPMLGNRSALVWTERAELAPALMELGEADFMAEIARRFGAHLGAIESVGARWSYPLRFHLARSYVRPRFALAGDAAHAIHPIAGQGLNLGFKDAAALAETILDAARLGLDFGAEDVLQRYERWRRFDNFVLAGSHGCVQPAVLERHRAAEGGARSWHGHCRSHRPAQAVFHAPGGRRNGAAAAPAERRSRLEFIFYRLCVRVMAVPGRYRPVWAAVCSGRARFCRARYKTRAPCR